MLKKANYGMNIPQSTQGQFPAPPVGALNNPAYAQAYSKYMSNNPNLGMQPNQFASRSEFMYAAGGPISSKKNWPKVGISDEDRAKFLSESNAYSELANKYLAATKAVGTNKSKLDKELQDVNFLRNRLGSTAAKHGEKNHFWNDLGISKKLAENVDSLGFGCNTASGACMREAGLTVPEGPDIEINGINYSAGDKLPYIPGNPQFNKYAKRLGWELQPKGTKPTQAGDLIRGHMYASGDPIQHSVLSNADKDGDGLPDLYNNPGNIIQEPYQRRTGKGDMNTGANNYYINDSGVMRYVRNIPQYTKELELAKEEALKQKQAFKNNPMPKSPKIPVQLFENSNKPTNPLDIFSKYPLTRLMSNNYGGPTVPYTKETSTAFSGNRGQGPLQAGFNNATPGEYPAISFARNRTTQNVGPRQWANLVVGDLNKPMGVTDTIESMSKNTGATSKRVPMDIYFKNGGNLPKANMGAALTGVTDFLGSEQGGQLMNTIGQLAPIVQGMINKPQQGQRPMQTPQQGMMNPYGMPYTNNPYLPQPQKHQAPTYGGFTYGGLSGKEAEALGMPNYGRQFAYGGMLPKHGFGDFLTSAADAATETIGSGMKIMDPLNIGYGTALSRGMGNLVGEDRYQKGWDQFTDGTQAFVGGAAKGAAGVLPGQIGSLATKGMDAVSGIADNALNNNEYGQLYEGQDKLKQIAGGAGQIGGAVGGGILTGNVAGAVGSGMQGAGNVMQGIDMNNAGEQTGGGWQTAGNITNAASGLASFLPTGAYGGKLPSYGFGNQIGLPGYMGDKDKEITINAMNRATPIQSMYNQTPQYQHGMGQSMRGFGPGNQMAYGEMFAKGGKLPSYNHGGGGPHNGDTVYSMMNRSGKLKGVPSYFGSRASFSNTPEGITTMQNDLQPMNISAEDYLEMDQAKKALEIEQAKLRDYYGQQNYSQTEGIPVDKVNELSPTYYDKMTAYQNMLKDKAGIENTNLAGNIEGTQIPYNEQAFGFRHNSYRPGLHAAENYTQSTANVSEYDPRNVDMGQQRYTKDGREKLNTEQNNLLRNEGIPTNTGLKSENMMFYGNTGPIGVMIDELGRKYLQGEDGSNLGYFGEDFAYGGNLPSYYNGGGFKPSFNAGVKYKFQDGGAMQGQHPQAQYEVEKDEIMYHPNDKPVSLANGGLNQVANDYSKVTGNKHNHPNGGPQMAGGEGGYVYSDQLKVPKDLYNSLKGLI